VYWRVLPIVECLAYHRSCEIFLQNCRMILCFFLVLTTCLLLGTHDEQAALLPAVLQTRLHFFRYSSFLFLFLKLASKADYSLEAFLTPSSLTETQNTNIDLQAPMSQTLTAIAHPLASKAIHLLVHKYGSGISCRIGYKHDKGAVLHKYGTRTLGFRDLTRIFHRSGLQSGIKVFLP
jgi:hypothetical protein